MSECRNAIEHYSEGQNIVITNFSLKPGNKFSSPTWTYDLTKKLKLKKGPHDLLNDLDVFCSNMLHLFEDLMVLVAQDKLSSHPVVVVCKLNEVSISKECPIRYDLTVKTELASP